IELFAGFPDPIAGRQTYIAAGAGAGRARCAEAVYPPLSVYAVPAQVGNTVSVASSPIQGEADRAGPYSWGSAESGPRAAELTVCQHRDQPAAEYLHRGWDGHTGIGILQRILRE
ncbi:hypothetical protein BDV36DRAFT_250939, partial [Aspergillus pseudocaelatus]